MNDVPDASDWSQTLIPELCKFESHLQCPICRELLSSAPTIAECGHTFCNVCITRHIRTDNKCPVCRHEIQAGKLRPNKLIDDLLETWIAGNIRSKLLQLTKKPQPETIEIDLESEDSIPEGYAECPICSKIFPISVIESSHIAKCVNGVAESPKRPHSAPQTARKKRAVFSPPPPLKEDFPEVKLAVPSFHTMAESKIRAKLKEYGLSTKGSKQQLVARYMEWVTIWNGTLMERRPKTVYELKRHMNAWDQQQDFVPHDLKKANMQAWAQKYKHEFEELILQAKSNRSVNKNT